MARRKKTTTLFEAFGDGMATPDWMSRGDKAPGPDRPEPTRLKRPPEIDRPAPQPPHSQDARPLVAGRTGGRLNLSLGYPGCIAILLGLLILLALAFKLGRMSSGTSKATEAGVDITAPGHSRESGDYDFKFVQDKALAALPTDRLLVIQQNIESVDDARRIQRYLWEVGGYLTLVNIETQPDLISVIDTQKISGMSDEEIERRREALKELGSSPDWELSDKYDFSKSIVFDRP